MPVVGTWLGGDHPRMCGEHDSGKEASLASGGSSPHVRGAPSPTRPCSKSPVDHPRMCGEHLIVPFGLMSDPGSSPHVRGALSDCQCVGGFCGIIPACAGSTTSRTSSRTLSGDHPRMCGEHEAGGAVRMSDEGSSPHVRGAHSVTCACLPTLGIIPACAGSTSLIVTD